MTSDCSTSGAELRQPAWRRVGLGVLSQVITPGLIDEAVAETGRVQARVRLLPARVVVLFVLGLALFSGQGYRQVWRELVSGWPALARVTPTRSAFTKARRRLGEQPLAWLFARVRGWRGAAGAPGVFAFGLRLVSWDGTTMVVPDSPENAHEFGRTRGGKGAVGGYPRVRLLALVECGTRAVIDAAFGRYSEQDLAQRLVPSLRRGMLLLADRNFSAYLLWAQLRAQGVHLLWRVSAHRVLPVLRALPDGSWLSQITPSQQARKLGAKPIMVRVVRYTVTVTSIDQAGNATIRTETIRLVTSLLNVARANARDLASSYHQRWESENGYQELKTWLRGPSVVLRSADPEGVRQEMWAYLVVYQGIRHLIAEAAADLDMDTDTMSFLTCLRTVRRKIINLAVVAGQGLADAFAELVDHLLDDEIPVRRQRTSDRAVKRPVKPYKAKKPGMTSAAADYHIGIHPAPSDSTS